MAASGALGRSEAHILKPVRTGANAPRIKLSSKKRIKGEKICRQPARRSRGNAALVVGVVEHDPRASLRQSRARSRWGSVGISPGNTDVYRRSAPRRARAMHSFRVSKSSSIASCRDIGAAGGPTALGRRMRFQPARVHRDRDECVFLTFAWDHLCSVSRAMVPIPLTPIASSDEFADRFDLPASRRLDSRPRANSVRQLYDERPAVVQVDGSRTLGLRIRSGAPSRQARLPAS